MDGQEPNDLLPVPVDDEEQAITTETEAERAQREADEQMTEDELFAAMAEAKFPEPIEKVKFIAKGRLGRFLRKRVDTPYLTFNVWQSLEEAQKTMLAYATIARTGRIQDDDRVISFPPEAQIKAAEMQVKVANMALEIANTLRLWNDYKGSLPRTGASKKGRNLPPDFGGSGNMIYAEQVTINDAKSANNGANGIPETS